MTSEQRREFEEAAKPLIKWLNENWHPHVKVLVDQTSAEVVEGCLVFRTEEFLKD